MRDENFNSFLMKRLKKTQENLIKNGMECVIVDNASDAADIVREMLEPGMTVASGGSVTLAQTGIIDLLRSGSYNYLDRSGLTGDAIKKCYRDSLSADVYICSSNAITENGELFNVDGNGNRVAAICYGPDKVIIVAGVNKIVTDINCAIHRVKRISAPANSQRLGCRTYCTETGECMAYASGNISVAAGCRSEQRICCDYVLTGYQRVRGRICVVLVAEDLGY